MSNNKIEIRHIHTLEEFEALKNQWHQLIKECSRETVFLTWEWLYAWWKIYNDGKKLWLLTAWQKNELVGIAPLMLSTAKKYKIRFRLLQTLGTPNTDESDFLARNNSREIITELCTYILNQRSQWDAIELNEHQIEYETTKTIRGIFEQTGLILRQRANSHYHIPIAGQWETYFNSLSKKLQQNIKRRLRRTMEGHKFKFEHHRGTDVRWEHFNAIFEINRSGNFPEKYQPEQERSFHRELLGLMQTQGWIEIALILLDDKPVAFEYGFNVAGKFEDWRVGHNKSFTKEGIGKTLIYLLLQELFSHGYSDFDFLRGEYEHKNDWQPSRRDFVSIIAVRSTHIPARVALITIPIAWHWTKEKILPGVSRLLKKRANQLVPSND